MLTKFGIKEAIAAGKFAKTKEQKETVFGVLAMMNVPVVLGKQLGKVINKNIAKGTKLEDKIALLDEKVQVAGKKITETEIKIEEAMNTQSDWNLQ